MRIEFRVYFDNGNQKLFMVSGESKADCKAKVREYCIKRIDETGGITKIEFVKEV